VRIVVLSFVARQSSPVEGFRDTPMRHPWRLNGGVLPPMVSKALYRGGLPDFYEACQLTLDTNLYHRVHLAGE